MQTEKSFPKTNIKIESSPKNTVYLPLRGNICDQSVIHKSNVRVEEWQRKKIRLLVLTAKNLKWYKRNGKQPVDFGEERGSLQVSGIQEVNLMGSKIETKLKTGIEIQLQKRSQFKKFFGRQEAKPKSLVFHCETDAEAKLWANILLSISRPLPASPGPMTSMHVGTGKAVCKDHPRSPLPTDALNKQIARDESKISWSPLPSQERIVTARTGLSIRLVTAGNRVLARSLKWGDPIQLSISETEVSKMGTGLKSSLPSSALLLEVFFEQGGRAELNLTQLGLHLENQLLHAPVLGMVLGIEIQIKIRRLNNDDQEAPKCPCFFNNVCYIQILGGLLLMLIAVSLHYLAQMARPFTFLHALGCLLLGAKLQQHLPSMFKLGEDPEQMCILEIIFEGYEITGQAIPNVFHLSSMDSSEIIQSHQFKSLPDSDAVPLNFIRGCLNDKNEAARRWKVTRRWRVQEKIDGILTEPQPHFDVLKRYWPHFYHGYSRKGNNVYYQRDGYVDIPALKKNGIQSVDEMVRYYIFQTEWLWNHLDAREDGKTVAVFDMEAVSLKHFRGEPFELARKTSQLVQEHYPERAEAIIIINAPSWFSLAWKMIRPFVNEITQKKIRIAKASQNLSALSDFIEPDNIPRIYGGLCVCGKRNNPEDCRWQSSQEVLLKNFVSQLQISA